MNWIRKLFGSKKPEPEPEQPDIIEALFCSLLLRQMSGPRSKGNAPIPMRFLIDEEN